MSNRVSRAAFAALTHMRTNMGCVAQPGTHTVRLPDLKDQLATWFLTTPHAWVVSAKGGIEQGVWQELQRAVTRANPGYHLCNETTGKNSGGWGPTWFFTNDPVLMNNHDRAIQTSARQTFINSHLRLSDGTQGKHAARIYSVFGLYVEDIFQGQENLPGLIDQAHDGSARWKSVFDARRDCENGGIHSDEVAQALWDLYRTPLARKRVSP